MKKFLIFFLTLLPLAIASCGGDEKDEPNDPSSNTQPNQPYEIYEHTFGGGNGQCQIYSERTYGGWGFVYVNVGDYYINNAWQTKIGFIKTIDSSIKYLDYGQVSSLSGINKLPSTGWKTDNGVAIDFDLKLNEGYVVEIFDGSSFIYFRLFISEFIYSASGSRVGIKMQYQRYTPSK